MEADVIPFEQIQMTLPSQDKTTFLKSEILNCMNMSLRACPEQIWPLTAPVRKAAAQVHAKM